MGALIPSQLQELATLPSPTVMPSGAFPIQMNRARIRIMNSLFSCTDESQWKLGILPFQWIQALNHSDSDNTAAHTTEGSTPSLLCQYMRQL